MSADSAQPQPPPRPRPQAGARVGRGGGRGRGTRRRKEVRVRFVWGALGRREGADARRYRAGAAPVRALRPPLALPPPAHLRASRRGLSLAPSARPTPRRACPPHRTPGPRRAACLRRVAPRRALTRTRTQPGDTSRDEAAFAERLFLRARELAPDDPDVLCDYGRAPARSPRRCCADA